MRASLEGISRQEHWPEPMWYLVSESSEYLKIGLEFAKPARGQGEGAGQPWVMAGSCYARAKDEIPDSLCNF